MATKPVQLELGINRQREPDRNLAKGGRSFYFFDFDDNVAFLTTPTYLRHRETRQEIQISSREMVEQSHFIGKSGVYAEYELDMDPDSGSFRNFRDRELTWMERWLGGQQRFIEDLANALAGPDLNWRGPSWNGFYHAVFNARPVALITARGHHPETLKKGIDLWVQEGHLPQAPNYLALYPVSHPEVKASLGLPDCQEIPPLKKAALRAAVHQALREYGVRAPHRFGMSDDDPKNLAWIAAEMRALKTEFPHMSFFVIQARGDDLTKYEIFSDHTEDEKIRPEAQLTLFDQ